MASTSFNDIVAYLGTLPASTNKIQATADLIYQSTLIRPNEPVYQYSLYIVTGLFSWLTINSFAVLVVRQPFSVSKWFTTQRGLLLPNASTFYAFFNILYGMITVADMVIQIKNNGRFPASVYNEWTILTGTRFIPIFLAGWFYCWATCTASWTSRLQSHDDDIRPVEWGEDAVTRALKDAKKRRIVAWIFDVVGIAGAIVMPAITVYLFIVAGRKYTEINDRIEGVISKLNSVAPSYNPDTFTVVTLVPFLLPLSNLTAQVKASAASQVDGWINWLVWDAFLLIVSAPFVIAHARLLRKMSKARSKLSGSVENPSSASHGQIRSVGGRIMKPLKELNEYSALLLTISLIYALAFMYFTAVVWAIERFSATERDSGTDRTAFNLAILLGPQMTYGVVGNIIIVTLLIQSIRKRWHSGTTSPSKRTAELPTDPNHPGVLVKMERITAIDINEMREDEYRVKYHYGDVTPLGLNTPQKNRSSELGRPTPYAPWDMDEVGKAQ